MLFSNSNRALLQGIMAAALVLAGAGACSRPDRNESGDNTAALTQDTSSTAAEQGTGTRTGIDTSAAMDTHPEAGTAPGDTAPARLDTDAPRAATAPATGESQDTSLAGDTAAAGYRAMERDTANVPQADSARVTEDTSEISGTTTDTSAVETAGAAELPDTGSVEIAAEDVDTSANADAEVAVGAEAQDTAGNAGRVRPPEDSTEILGQVTADTSTIVASVDTTADRVRPPEDSTEFIGQDTTDVGADVEMARDTTTTADQIDTTGVAVTGAPDTTGNAGRVRPIEDSTEVAGQVTTDSAPSVVAQADTMESDRVRPPEDSTELHGNAIGDETADEQEIEAGDRESVAAADEKTDEVGAAAVAGTVTGAEAVAMITRGGARCIVVDPESEEEVRWDMSSTPVTLNPCGLGSMVLSKVETEK